MWQNCPCIFKDTCAYYAYTGQYINERLVTVETTFWMVAAFTDRAFTGNPAGIFFVDDFPDTPLMQAIAAELNWSQTAFIKRFNQTNHDNHFIIRWFSPRDETPICGHATLAAAHLLWEKGFATTTSRITFDSMAGSLHATRSPDHWITLDFPSKPLWDCDTPPLLQQALITANGTVDIKSVMRDDLIYVVTLRNQTDLVALTPNLTFIESLDCRAISVTTSGRSGYDFESRYFAPRVGIPEDPVCGSSHARLGPLWAKRLDKTELMAFQASRRGGTLKINVTPERVAIAGMAITVCESKLLNVSLQRTSVEAQKAA